MKPLRFTVAMVLAIAASMATLAASATVPKWISGGTDAPESPAPMLVREFALDAKPANAVFSVAVAGWCEVYVNGVKAGRDVLSPVTCQPDMRISSLDFDIADMLKSGTNSFEVLLGNGWQNMFTVGWGFPAPGGTARQRARRKGREVRAVGTHQPGGRRAMPGGRDVRAEAHS